MNIPTFINDKFVDESGYLTDTWRNVLTQLFTELQSNASNESLVVPQQTTTDIAKLTNYKGGLVYDSTTNQLKVNINGTFKVVTVT